MPTYFDPRSPLLTGASGGSFRNIPLHSREMAACKHDHSIGVQLTPWGAHSICDCWSTPHVAPSLPLSLT